jgi:hypothetical protein
MAHPSYLKQVKFCEDTKQPLFAPEDTCFSCGSMIWDKISEEKASEDLITGCPVCNTSYCD